MKIAIFSDFFYPELSGITDSITLLGKTLASRGHTIMYVVPSYSKKNYLSSNFLMKELDLGKNITIKRIPAISYPFSPTGQSRIVIPIGVGILAIKKFAPDIIHTNSSFGPGIEALIASKIFRIPLVGTNHTPFSEFMSSSPKFFVNTILYYNSWYYNQCKFTSAPCQSLLNEMKNFKLRTPNYPVSNPVDLSGFVAPEINEKEKIKKQFNLSPNTVIYTGRLAPEKNVDIIVKAIARAIEEIPNINFIITGHGSAEKDLKILAQKLCIESKVKFFGFVDEKTLKLLYQASDLFVIMSKAESQSLSLMQAMSVGLPVIGADARALPEYIENKKNGIIVPLDDENRLKEEIINLLKNREYSKNLGENGILSVKQYSALAIAEKWEKIYDNAIMKI